MLQKKPAHPQSVHFSRLVRSLQHIREHHETPKKKHPRPKLVAIRGGTPLVEANLPSPIREMLAEHRSHEQK